MKKEDLLSNMTNTKLIINMLAKAYTKNISDEGYQSCYFQRECNGCRTGGNVAKVVRIKLEVQTGKKVVTSLNAESRMPFDKITKKANRGNVSVET
ncbi:MAG: hypothetical protein QM751_04095 [Paludibacteraceae bacterium]